MSYLGSAHLDLYPKEGLSWHLLRCKRGHITTKSRSSWHHVTVYHPCSPIIQYFSRLSLLLYVISVAPYINQFQGVFTVAFLTDGTTTARRAYHTDEAVTRPHIIQQYLCHTAGAIRFGDDSMPLYESETIAVRRHDDTISTTSAHC